MAAPGKAEREGITIQELMRLFPDDDTAAQFFADERWPDGPRCPYCDSERVQSGAKHKTMPYRCRACRKRFSVKTGTVMEASNLGCQTWALAAYLLTTNLKGVSSMKLHRDLGVTQKTAWYLAHRLREVWEDAGGAFTGPVEADETMIGGKEANKHARKRPHADWPLGKSTVAGVKDRATGKVSAAVVPSTDARTLKRFVAERTDWLATVYTDDHPSYAGLPNHRTVKHTVGEYVDGQAHTQEIESFWAMLKRAYYGTYYQMSSKHLDRYVGEFAGRHNVRAIDTIDHLRAIVRGMVGKRIRYTELTA